MTPTSTGGAGVSLRCAAFLCAFSVSWTITEYLAYSLAVRYSYFQIVALRYTVHLLAVVAFMAALGGVSKNVKSANFNLQVLRGFCMFIMPASFIATASLIAADQYLTGLWTAPILATALAGTWLGEKIPVTSRLLLASAYFGALLILRPSMFAPLAPLLGPALGGLSLAVYLALSHRLRTEPVSTGLFYTGAGALICILPFAVAVWRPILTSDLPTIAAIGCMGLLTLYCLDRAVELAPVANVMPLLYLQLLCAPLLGLLFGRPTLSISVALGMGIIGAVALYSLAAYGRAAAAR